MQVHVERAGLCDLIVATPRRGLARYGIPAGGAADSQALSVANRLVGNAADAAGLEISLTGPKLRFDEGGVVALTGASFQVKRAGGGAVAWNETLVLAPGEVLAMGAVEAGCRCWLAVQGGVVVEPVLGSASTCLPAGFGGFGGRALRAGDSLNCGTQQTAVNMMRAQAPEFGAETPLRVIAGPQIGAFSDAGLTAFFGADFQVGAASDRRGIRLSGPRVRAREVSLASQGVFAGAVQVPPDGHPIILGWDGPVTGGYPVIGVIIDADLPRVAQLRPGAAVRFETLDVAAAQRSAASPWTLKDLA